MDQNHDVDHEINPEPQGTYSALSKKAAAQFYISESAIEEAVKQFEEERAAMYKHLSRIRSSSLLTAFLIWVKTDPYRSPGTEFQKKLLFDSDLIPFFNEVDEADLTVNDIKNPFFLSIIENIRCDDRFDIRTKEDLIGNLCDFVRWSCTEARIARPDLRDLDRVIARNRAICYYSYTRLISKLEGKYQLIAKLMYFGGKPLSQVLNLNVQDIDFSCNSICFDDHMSPFPKHVIKDIKALIRDKTYGKIFSGRDTKELNPSTVFRNLKNAANKAYLGDNFTPKDLYKTKENQESQENW
jgi:integrase